MVRKVCLDSDTLISLLGGDEQTKQEIASIEAEFCTTAINSFEVWHGRKKNETVDGLLGKLEILRLDDESGRLAADILIELKRSGTPLGIRDLFIAAICITNKTELMTRNKKHFERMKRFGLIIK